MKSIYEKENKRLTFEIHEEIDEYVVQNMRRRIDNEIERYMPKEVIFDFKFSHDAVSFRHVADRRTSERFHIGRQWRIYPEQCQFYP